MNSERGIGRNWIVDSFTLVTAGLGAYFVSRAAGLEPTWFNVICVVSLVLVACLAALLCHELGHVVAGSLVGWQCEVFKLGPLLILRSGGGSRISLRKDPRFHGTGLVVMHPASEYGDTSWRRVLMLLGGPAASLIFAVVAFAGWHELSMPRARAACGVAALFSGIVFVTTIIPFTSSGHLSDGAAIVGLIRRREIVGGSHRHAASEPESG